MQINKILPAYKAIANIFGLPEMQSIQITQTVSTFDSHTALIKMIEAFTPTEGWLCFQSAITYVSASEPLISNDSNNGVLLNAELINAREVSLHVRQIGAAWATIQYAQINGTSRTASIAAEEFLVDNVNLSAAEAKYGLVCYQRLWQQQEIVGLVPVAARFMGFSSNDVFTPQISGTSV